MTTTFKRLASEFIATQKGGVYLTIQGIILTMVFICLLIGAANIIWALIQFAVTLAIIAVASFLMFLLLRFLITRKKDKK